MTSLKIFDQRARLVFTAVLLMLTAAMPAMVSAAQVTERSIALSSSSAGAAAVSYQVNFKADANGAAGAFVVDFCSNSPVIGQTCTAPAGFNASSAASTTAGFTDVTGATSKVTVAGTIAGGATVSVDLTGIHNPTNEGPLYARIVSYDTKTNALTYTSTDLKTGSVDQGGVAISITPTIGVSGLVMETMTFCVSGETIDDGCVGSGSAAPNLAPPTLKLGHDVGGVIALDSQDVYTGTINTQISTNASSGAIVSLKSNATGCGGLKRAGAPSACDILPALSTDVAQGEAKFGVKLGANVTDPTDGDFQAYATSVYNSTNFRLNYATGDASGVTSTYGDPILDTNSKPANNRNMPLTFGASVTNNTPAGNYSADLSLIATGKF